MPANNRPLSATIIAAVYIAVGAIGFAIHFAQFRAVAIDQDLLWAELVQLVAIASGAFMLRGDNWARWVALAWIAFHVILSAFHPLTKLALHSAFCVIIAWLLFVLRPPGTFAPLRREPCETRICYRSPGR